VVGAKRAEKRAAAEMETLGCRDEPRKLLMRKVAS